MRKEPLITRRTFLKAAGLSIAGTFFLPKLILAKSAVHTMAEKRLNLYHLHTGETFNQVFWADGQFIPERIKEINKILRDWRTDEQTEMSVELLSLLNNMMAKLDNGKPIEIISAYRCKKTNEGLRRKKKGIAKESRHITGHAIDFRIEGKRLKNLRDCALSFQAGGVGYYPKAGFIHVDIRDKPTRW